MPYTREQVEAAVKAKGYVWFEGAKDYDVNIVGIRNLGPSKHVTNLFDDTLTISYKKNGVWQFHEWAITTDPGKKAMLEYSNPKGVAILVPGQYRGSHMIGLHQGKYEALRQQRPVKVWRDKDKDMEYDWVDEDTGEVTRVDGLQHILRTHCSQMSDYISPHTTLVDAVFRVFLANNNKPLTSVELGKRTGRDPSLILKTLSGKRVYKGLRPRLEE